MWKFYAKRVATVFAAALFLVLTVVSLLPSSANAAGVVYVDKNAAGNNTGADWANAYTDLQSALSNATAGTEIWVAKGVYTPGINVADTFQLVDGVSIYGGFAATETDRTERDWKVNLSILSGDIDGDDAVDARGVVTSTNSIVGGNNHHVVTGSGVTRTARLDGFIVTAGKADGATPFDLGGGIYNHEGSPTLYNLVLSGNYAVAGGGMENNNNSPVIHSIDFVGNTATLRGGGMHNGSSSFTLQNVTFQNNFAPSGGGMDNYASTLILDSSTFSGNISNNGGGIYSSASHLTAINTLFINNKAHLSFGGGGMYNLKGHAYLYSVAFLGNYANQSGGALRNFDSKVQGINLTFANNSSDANGGGIFNESSSDVVLVNAILWGNRDVSGLGTIAASIVNNSSVLAISHSLVQGSNGSGNDWVISAGVDGGNNIDSDPLFVSASDFQVQQNSPAVDAGNTISYTDATSVTTDLAGNTRIQNSVIDMGAYETDPNASAQYMLVVANNGDGSGNVASVPAGINCGLTCTAAFDSGTMVTLTATADSNSTFVGWGGACPNMPIALGDCVVTIDSAQTITATFERKMMTIYLPMIVR